MDRAHSAPPRHTLHLLRALGCGLRGLVAGMGMGGMGDIGEPLHLRDAL